MIQKGGVYIIREWRPIEGHNKYYVSNLGEVYSAKSNKILVPWYDGKHKYLQVQLSDDNKQTKINVHILVAKAFISNPENKPEVNHKDHNSFNNIVDNLEWVTRKENMHHCFEKYSPVRNFRECCLYKGEEIVGEFKSISDACRYGRDKYGLSYSTLSKYRKVKDFRILPKTQTTISKESTPDDKLLVEVPTTLTSQVEGKDIVQSLWKHKGN